MNLPFGDFLFLFYKDTLFAFTDSLNFSTAACLVLAFFKLEWKNVSKDCSVEIFVKMTRVCCWSHYFLEFLLLVLWYHWNEWVLHQAIFAVTGLAVLFNFVKFILGKSLEVARFFIFHFQLGAFRAPRSYQLTELDGFGFFLPMLRLYFFLFVGFFDRVVQMSGLGTNVRRKLGMLWVFLFDMNHGATKRWKLGGFCGDFQLFGLVEFNLHG